MNMSSQISTPIVRPSTSVAANSRSVPNGAGRPATSIVQTGDAVPGGELATLVELAVVRQVQLRHHTEHLAAVDDHGGVEQPGLVAQRGADDEHRQQIGGGLDDLRQALVDRVEQGVLTQQVVDGVAGQRQFREQRDRDTEVGAAPADVDDALGVAHRVGDRDVGRARGDAGEAVAVQRVERHAPILPGVTRRGTPRLAGRGMPRTQPSVGSISTCRRAAATAQTTRRSRPITLRFHVDDRRLVQRQHIARMGLRDPGLGHMRPVAGADELRIVEDRARSSVSTATSRRCRSLSSGRRDRPPTPGFAPTDRTLRPDPTRTRSGRLRHEDGRDRGDDGAEVQLPQRMSARP